MRIYELTTVHPWGDPRITDKISQSLAAAGHDVVLCAPGAPVEPVPGVRGVALPIARGLVTRFWHRPRAIQTLLQAEAEPAILHAHDPELLPWLLWWKRMGHRVVFDIHEDIPASFAYKTYLPIWWRGSFGRIAKHILRICWRRMDALIAATPELAEQAREAASPVPVRVVQNLPRLERFSAEALGARDGSDTTPTAVYVGSLTTARGLATMLMAFYKGIPGVPDARLLLAGPCHTPELTDMLEREKGKGNVTWLGTIAPAGIPAVLAQAQIGLCILDDTENYRRALPTKVLEYQAAGLAVIASTLPSHEKLVSATDTGVLIPPNDIDALRDALSKLWGSPTWLAGMRERGPALAKVRGWDGEVDTLVGVMNRLIDAEPTSTAPTA